MRFLKLSIAAALLPLVAACAGGPNTDATKNMSNTQSPFYKALQSEYVMLAVAEADEMDYEDAHYFNNKAIAATKGGDVGPQALKERKIGGDAKWELEAARQALRASLLGGSTKWAPKESARAQAMFDCWMQEQEEGDQQDHIDACRTAFDEALAKAEGMRPPMKAAAPKKKMMAPIPGPFVVYFDFDSFDMSATGAAVVKEAAKAGKAAGIKGVQVVGHTDTAGSADYNEGLGRARAATVRNALIVEGFTRSQTVRSTKGETDLAVSTGDNTKEARNRRVTITFTR